MNSAIPKPFFFGLPKIFDWYPNIQDLISVWLFWGWYVNTRVFLTEITFFCFVHVNSQSVALYPQLVWRFFFIMIFLFLGHGFSSAPDRAKSYTFSKLLRDVLTIFDHFVPRSRECVVVAHSYGSSLAAALTRSRPESVKLLVMCSSGGPTPLCPPKEFSKIPKFLISCLKPFLR